MPWINGEFKRTNNTYEGSTVWQQDDTNGFAIESDRHDFHDEDIAEGISACLNINGQNQLIANLPMNGNRVTGLGSPVNDNDAARKVYVDDAVGAKIADGVVTNILWNDGTTWKSHPVAAITSNGTLTALKFEGKIDLANVNGLQSALNLKADTSALDLKADKSALNLKFDKSGGTISGNLSVSGSITASGNVTAYSDERLKEDLMPTMGLSAVNAMNGYNYRMKATGDYSAGVIAQELLEVAPELVSQDDEGMMSVNYMGLTAYLIEAVKELSLRVSELESR